MVKAAGEIQSTCQRMTGLINSLLDANAIEEGRFTSQVERCDVGRLVAESIRHNQANAQRKAISVEVRLEPGLEMKADRAATLQILDNLVSNAIKYSPAGSGIQVTGRLEAQRVALAVRDPGPGLSEADQAKLFRKFTRLTPRPTGGEPSTGLGLSIVKRLAEAMQGTVTCASRLGEGSTFTVALPVWADGPP